MTKAEESAMKRKIQKLKRCEERATIAKEISAFVMKEISSTKKLTLRGVAEASGVPFNTIVNWLYNAPGSMRADSAKKILRVLK